MTFAGTAGETESIIVTITDDVLVESSETYTVDLSNITGGLATIGDAQGDGTITDNDAASITIDDVSVAEGAGTATFTVTLNNAVAGGFDVDYTTTDGTALAGSDYTAASGTLTFAGTAGETESIIVTITDDVVVESSETYTVDLSNITGGLATIGDAQGDGTITDNDAASITIDDVSVAEGAGTATFTVTLNNAVAGGFDVDYTTTDGTALAGSDYTAASGTLTFAGTAGETESIIVTITDDVVVESSETYTVDLSNITGGLATIGDAQGDGTITDNDAASITIDDVSVAEGAGTATFTVTLNNAVAGGFDVDYTTTDGTALAGSDYTAASGTLTFAGTAGETESIIVTITDDVVVESSETYTVDLSNITGGLATIGDAQGDGTITDNDAASITIDDVSVAEGAGTATFTVTLNNAVAGGFDVDYTTTDGTALAGSDYTAASGTLTFAGTAGETESIIVTITDDVVVESSETYTVDLSNITGGLATIGDAQGDGTITDNDAASITIDDVSVAEGAGTATFTVTLNNAVAGGFDVDYTTTDGTALAGSDYTAASGTLTFAGTAGETESIIVTITDDVVVESSETYTVDLSNITGGLATIGDAQG